MSIIHKIKNWGDRHHPKILDIIRMMFGIFLLSRGFYFFNHAGYLRELLIASNTIRESPKIIDIINKNMHNHQLELFAHMLLLLVRSKTREG